MECNLSEYTFGNMWRTSDKSAKMKETYGKACIVMNLIEKTETLLAVCGECLARHARMRELDVEPDFFNEVKPYTDKVHALIDEWRLDISEWMKIAKPMYVHPVQIDSVEDSMKQFVVQSFYQKTGKKRFVLSINSAEYTFKTVLDALRKTEEGESE